VSTSSTRGKRHISVLLKYEEVQRSTRKYQEIQRSTKKVRFFSSNFTHKQKYQEVPRSTKKHKEVPEVQKYAVSPLIEYDHIENDHIASLKKVDIYFKKIDFKTDSEAAVFRQSFNPYNVR
jgi:hypothetical protein